MEAANETKFGTKVA